MAAVEAAVETSVAILTALAEMVDEITVETLALKGEVSANAQREVMDQHLKPTNQQISNSQIVFFTGGGSGGHVVPALTLIKELKSQHPDIELHYIGGIHSIERELVKPFQLTYHPIYNGKLRRYFSLENALDFFRIVVGIFQAFFILLKFKKSQSLIFSTGGFVSLPVVIAGKFLRIPIFIHEQTSRVGLANKIASFFSEKIFVSFLESLNYFPKKNPLIQVIH